MPVPILMPALSPTMEEGKLAAWLVAEGDEVRAGAVIAEIETDKATMEVEAVDEGRMGRILIAAGTEAVRVNTPIALLLEEGEEPSALDTALETALETAPVAGAQVSETQPKPADVSPEPRPATTLQSARPANGARIFASPLARRIAEQKGVDLAGLTGSGPRGRIVKADVEAAAAPTAAHPETAPTPMPASPSSETVAALYQDRRYEEVPLDPMRRTVAARLTEAKQTVPHFYLRRSVTLGPLLDLRRRMNGALEGRGIKLSVNDFIIRAAALALQEVPEANAVWAGDRILRFAASDVAVAVAVDGGLFTPVLRDAETLGLGDVSQKMKALADRARARRLAPAEYQGGSFAISNLGMYGIESFDAVINPPQAAILAVGAGAEGPVAVDGTLAVATRMAVTLSCDHRVIDGALGATLLAAIVAHLEEPLGMLV
ncbi:MAG: pyruvate dehydrogenase complex dihydrolipoamide acetyltransferase [Pseudomonadota bacterium]